LPSYIKPLPSIAKLYQAFAKLCQAINTILSKGDSLEVPTWNCSKFSPVLNVLI
jgi:hypothetical protein